MTNRVWGIGPSTASTNKSTESTIDRILSTSPPKSACPGVSTILMRKSFQLSDVFFARIVIPLSCSIALLSITRVSSAFFLESSVPVCFSSSSSSVVLP